MQLSIIVPLFNEQDYIIDVLKRIEKVTMPEFVHSLEIIIVDDCSIDNSNKLITEYIRNKTNYKLIRQDFNQGKGAAVKKGFEMASGDVFFIQDADMELLPDDLPDMLRAMHELKVEFVNGSRYLPGIVRPIASYKRYLANRLFTFMTSVLINAKLTDMACGHKLIHRNLISKITLEEKRFGFEAELILKALRIKKNNIAEVPVRYFPRNAGEGKKLKSSDAFKILWTIIKYGLLKL
ncbi:MAG: glycosyltransferase family 2 protein [Bacteroidales bacterium]|nr:glycosyltransferase family 2 protein [Bacteroidales bacterium]